MKKFFSLTLSVILLLGLFSFGLSANAGTILYGDANGDGLVMVSDAVKVSKYSVNATTLTDSQFIAADTNDDGKVNVGDAVLIARFSAGLIDKFPADKISGPTIFPPIEF